MQSSFVVGVVVSGILLASGAVGRGQPPAPEPSVAAAVGDVHTVADWLTGEFDTFAQVSADETAHTAYLHDRVVLRVVPVRIPGFHDGPADRTIYLEQAQAATPDRPYRQGVYVVTRVEGRVTSQTFRLADPAPFLGGTEHPGRLAGLTPDALVHLEGCDVTWVRLDPSRFRGSMGDERSCKSARNGGTWMTAHNELTASVTITLDRGYDDGGVQKWGPPAGVVGHMFVRRR